MKLINYPAMASPVSIEFIGETIEKSLCRKSNIIDPFCGTGRLLINPRKSGHNVTGLDISPIAILSARVIHQRTSFSQLEKDLKSIKKYLASQKQAFFASEEELFWFPEIAYHDLRTILAAIDTQTYSSNTRRFMWLCLTVASRISSYTREDEYKSHRMKPEARILYKPDTLAIFLSTFDHILTRLKKMSIRGDGKYRLINGDLIQNKNFSVKFDALITSPPYGDSISTVGYGQFARIPLAILSHSEKFNEEFVLPNCGRSLDCFCLGGSMCPTSDVVQLPETISHISSGPMKKFCLDYFQRLDTAIGLLTDKPLCCLVLADRTYKSKKFPMIESTIAHMKNVDFKLIDRHDRFLAWKRLPRAMKHIHKNATAQHTGMNYESILVFSR